MCACLHTCFVYVKISVPGDVLVLCSLFSVILNSFGAESDPTLQATCDYELGCVTLSSNSVPDDLFSPACRPRDENCDSVDVDFVSDLVFKHLTLVFKP